MLAEPARARAARAGSLLLVANANASGVGPELVRTADRALRAAGARVESATTATAAELVAAVSESGARRVALLGGDGSIHLAANSIPDVEIAVLPAGRANNVAHSLGIPRNLSDAAELAVHGAARPLDAIVARSADRQYVAVEGVSIGFLAQARAAYDAPNSAAVGAALAAGARALRKFRPIHVVVESHEMDATLTIGQMFAANLPRYAFGLQVAPGADARDGLLDVVTLVARGRAALLALGASVRRGTHIRSPLVRIWRTAHLRIDPRGASPVVADSVNLGTGAVELSVLRGALQVVGP